MSKEPPHHNPHEMSRRGKIGALWRLMYSDRQQMTQAARDAKLEKLKRELDPEGTLSAEELDRRVQYAQQEWSARMHQKRWGKKVKP